MGNEEKACKNKNYELCTQYPYLKIHNAWTGEVEEPYDYTYTEADSLPKGWRRLFLQLCEDIREPLIKANLLDSFYFLQVKEKYNRMECYNNGAPEEVHRIIGKYSVMASYICTNCGKPATFETDGYIASYCDDCWKDCVRHERGEWIKFKPYYKVSGWNKTEGRYEKTISFEDEWNHYLKSLGEE